MNTDELEAVLYWAERRVLEIQAKLHRWAIGDRERRFDDLFNLAAPRKRLVISPVKPGGTRREVPGSDGLPDAERLMGTRACQLTRGRVQAYGTALWGTRVIWRKLDCLNPNLQKMEVHIRRKDA